MSNPCPICQREMKRDHLIKFIDYYCHPSRSDHHYAKRTTVTCELIECKVRFKEPSNEKIFLKVQYQEGYSEVWTGSYLDARTRIEYPIQLNFDDIEKIRAKIRTCLVFS